MTTEIDTYTSNNQETICPHCGEAEEHEAESLPWDDGREVEMYCNDCEKEYIATCSVLYSRESFKIDCKDDNHNLGEVEEGVSQKTADRWNRDNFLGRSGHKPTRIRKCLDCCHYQLHQYFQSKCNARCRLGGSQSSSLRSESKTMG